MTSLIQSARDLQPLIHASREEIDRSRQLPEALVAALRSAGMFRLFLPAKFGGFETDPICFVRIVEELASVDGSVGWLVSVCSVGGLFAGYMPEAHAADILRLNPDFHVSGSLNSNGDAVTTEAGYLISGKWTYASGIHHAPWVYVSCKMDDGSPARLMLLPVAECEVHDTWHVGGLRGTGSHDVSVRNKFVPTSRSLVPFTGQPSQPGALYKYPFTLFPVLIAAVPLGIARGAIEAWKNFAATKQIGERSSAQAALGRAEALFRGGRAFLFETLREIASEIDTHGEATPQTRAVLRLACAQAAHNSAKAVDLMYEAAGISALFDSTPLERHFRDVHAALQHIAVAPVSYIEGGRILLGFDPGTNRY